MENLLDSPLKKTILGFIVGLIVIVVVYFIFFRKTESQPAKPNTTVELKPISSTNDTDGIKNGKYNEVPNNKVFGSNSNNNNWNISIKFNLEKFNNTLQCIIGKMQDNNSVNNWGLWITPQRKLQWRIGNSSWDLNNFGELKDNTLYEINITYSGNYSFSLKDLSSNKPVEYFNVIDSRPIVIEAPRLNTNSGAVTFGGDFPQSNANSKFLGSISEIKSSEVVASTTNPPATTMGQPTMLPTTMDQPTTMLPTTTGQPTTMLPTTTDQPTTMLPTTTMIQITTAQPISFTTSNLLARYDASSPSNYILSGDSVSQWNDLSGNGFHLIPNGTGPILTTIKSKSAFNFNSDRGLIRNGVPLSTPITIFIVINYKSLARTWGNFIHHGHRDTDWAIEKVDNSNNINFQSNNDNQNVLISLENNKNYILVGRIVGNTRQLWVYSDTLSPKSVSGTTVTITAGNKTLYVGKSESNEACNSIIGEILYYNSSLSDNDLNTNVRYLQNKWF